ncbi:MAG: YgfZ/GcvT domain-containing protein [Actinomycetota bacterium]
MSGTATGFERRPWGLVVVTGADATPFLQSIVSQDLEGVAVGATVPSLLLAPQGKLDAMFRATRLDEGDPGGDEWWLDTEPGVADRLVAGLVRFRIRVDVAIEDRTESTALASLVGRDDVPAAPGLHRIPTVWGAQSGIDVLGPAPAVRAWLAESGVPVGTEAALEALRIEAGIPAQGVDVDETTIPQEAFLEREAVSFTKGCFIGQELVCRIDSRGHVNRFLRRLDVPGDGVPERGAAVVHGGKTVGSVTSAARVPGERRVVALAMVRREVEPPETVTVTVAGRAVPAALVG